MAYAVPTHDFDLEAELEKARDFYRGRTVAPEVLAAMDRQTAELISSGTLSGALAVGDRAPNFTLPNALGHEVTLSGLLRRGAAVVSFYRGSWCPYCQIALRNLQQHLGDFSALGAHLVAISPQTPDKTMATAQKLGLAFDVLTDGGARAASSFGIAFRLPDYLSALYDGFGHGLSEYNGVGNEVLPVPATFVIDTDRIVRYAFVTYDYTRRADPQAILTELRTLR